MANLLRKFAPLRQKGFQVLHRQPRLEGKVQAVAQDLPQLPDPGVDAVGGDEEPPPPASQDLGVQVRRSGLGEEVPGDGLRVHHRGHPHGEHRHSQGLPGEGHAVVAYAAAGDEAGVGHLHGAAQPVQPPGRQGVHYHHGGGLQALCDAPDPLRRLQPRGAQHAASQGRHRPEVRQDLPQVPGDEQMLQSQGPQGVRGHGGVAQARHQHRPLLRQQGLQERRRRPCGPHRRLRLPPPEGGDVQGGVAPPGFAQGPLPLLVQDLHPGQREALQLPLPGPDAGEGGGLTGALLPEGVGLSGQVGSDGQHNLRFSPFRNTKYGMPVLAFPE